MNETALKERLKVIAKEKGVNFNEIWKQLLLERFLARVSRSPDHDKFIFKGGLLLAQYIEIGRETTDIDFLVSKIKSEIPAIEAAMREIAGVKLMDGFQFEFDKIEEMTQPHMDYPGYRVTLNVNFGTMKDKIQIDIGVGDSVKPVENHFRPFEYNGKPIFEGEITLLTYPVVSIFSEKLETVISKGAFNSRMKDYHDLVLILREPGLLDLYLLNDAINETFKNRGTKQTFPIEFDPTGIKALEKLWSNHLAGLGIFQEKLNLPPSIVDVISEINLWLSKNGYILNEERE